MYYREVLSCKASAGIIFDGLGKDPGRKLPWLWQLFVWQNDPCNVFKYRCQSAFHLASKRAVHALKEDPCGPWRLPQRKHEALPGEKETDHSNCPEVSRIAGCQLKMENNPRIRHF
jgi:hypothetical protein